MDVHKQSPPKKRGAEERQSEAYVFYDFFLNKTEIYLTTSLKMVERLRTKRRCSSLKGDGWNVESTVRAREEGGNVQKRVRKYFVFISVLSFAAEFNVRIRLGADYTQRINAMMATTKTGSRLKGQLLGLSTSRLRQSPHCKHSYATKANDALLAHLPEVTVIELVKMAIVRRSFDGTKLTDSILSKPAHRPRQLLGHQHTRYHSLHPCTPSLCSGLAAS